MTCHRAFNLYVHVTWHTRFRAPVITAPLVPEVMAAIEHASFETNARVLRSAVLRDHIHLLLSLRPSTRMCDFLRLAKCVSAMRCNRRAPGRVQWARGYYVRSVGKRDLRVVDRYVRAQCARHPHLVP